MATTFESSIALANAATDATAKHIHSYNAVVQARTPEQRRLALDMYQRPFVQRGAPARRVQLPRNWAVRQPRAVARATAPTTTPTPTALPSWLQTQTIPPKGTLLDVSYDPTSWNVTYHDTMAQPTMPPTDFVVTNPYLAFSVDSNYYDLSQEAQPMPSPSPLPGPAVHETAAHQPDGWDAYAPWDPLENDAYAPWDYAVSPSPRPSQTGTCQPCSCAQ